MYFYGTYYISSYLTKSVFKMRISQIQRINKTIVFCCFSSPLNRSRQSNFLSFSFKGHGFHVGKLRLMIFISQKCEKVM